MLLTIIGSVLVSFEGCRSSDGDIFPAVLNCQNLEKINLCGFDNITHLLLVALVEKCPLLKSNSISSWRKAHGQDGAGNCAEVPQSRGKQS